MILYSVTKFIKLKLGFALNLKMGLLRRVAQHLSAPIAKQIHRCTLDLSSLAECREPLNLYERLSAFRPCQCEKKKNMVYSITHVVFTPTSNCVLVFSSPPHHYVPLN